MGTLGLQTIGVIRGTPRLLMGLWRGTLEKGLWGSEATLGALSIGKERKGSTALPIHLVSMRTIRKKIRKHSGFSGFPFQVFQVLPHIIQVCDPEQYKNRLRSLRRVEITLLGDGSSSQRWMFIQLRYKSYGDDCNRNSSIAPAPTSR